MKTLPSFVPNVLATCTNAKDKFIRSDGKSITLLTRFADIFRKKQDYDHFSDACTHLSQSTPTMKTLPLESRLEILGRFRQISKSLKHDDVKSKCDALLDKVETEVLEGVKAEAAVAPLFTTLQNVWDSKKTNLQVSKKDFA